MQKKIKLGVSDFALPAPRRGSIENDSGFAATPLQGLEIHQEIQQKKMWAHSSYRAEVRTAHQFVTDNYIFEVNGRMDGIYQTTPVRIEEIKSSFSMQNLFEKLKLVPDEHPYCLQLKTYGYIHWLQQGNIPELFFHLVSTRTRASVDLEIILDIPVYEKWLALRLRELTDEAIALEKRIKRRKKVAKKFNFPFAETRAGQAELMQTLEQGMLQKQPMLIQAPTGLGKTVGVFYPLLKDALTRGQKVIYLTPKNSQHSLAENAISQFQDNGDNIKSMTLTAKTKMCFKDEVICNPEYCEFARDHYSKIADNQLVDKLAKKNLLTANVFRRMARDHEVCPFDLQMHAVPEMDAVICDYNYVFSPNSAVGRFTQNIFADASKPNLIIDEAHNLPARAMDFYSATLTTAQLELMANDIPTILPKFQARLLKQLQQSIAIVNGLQKTQQDTTHKIEPPLAEFVAHDNHLREFLAEYLNSDVPIESNDPVMRLYFYWGEFTNALQFMTEDEEKFFVTFTPEPTMVKITCCDASTMLQDRYHDFAQIVGFSATLKPFDFYSKLSGLHNDKLKTAEFMAQFPDQHRKLLIIPQVSTKYSERVRNYPRIAAVIEKISALKRGNYFVFFPSFDFLIRVLEIFTPPTGFEILRQERGMHSEAVQDLIKQLSDETKAHIFFAVQGGVFSEGMDYPGNMAIGVFVVGPPLPNFDPEREYMRHYYQKEYSAGFDYAYTYPAMTKAIQAAGRVIRSETDKGLIVLMDNRFLQPSYSSCMPQDWFESQPEEMVSKNILQDVAQFWAQFTEEEIISPA